MLGINTNLASLNAQRNLATSQSALQTSLQRLSSGLRVNSAKDDAAGLAIAESMTSNIRGNSVAIRNANDAISMSQTAEGGLSKIGDNLQRMRELAVQARNGVNSTDGKAALQQEFKELQAEVTRVSTGTTFNGISVLANTAGSISFQVGAGTTASDSITVNTKNLNTEADMTAVTGGTAKIDGDAASIKTVIDNLDKAISLVAKERANMGAVQNRFDSVIGNLQVSVENQSAARGRILDADFASETANMTRNQILQQAGTAMLAQANQLPNNVLSLLR